MLATSDKNHQTRTVQFCQCLYSQNRMTPGSSQCGHGMLSSNSSPKDTSTGRGTTMQRQEQRPQQSYCPGLTPVETIFPNSTVHAKLRSIKIPQTKSTVTLLFLLLLHIWIFTKTNSIQLVLMCLSIRFSTALENWPWFFEKRVQDPSLNPKSIALDIVLAPSATVQGSSEVSPDTV